MRTITALLISFFAAAPALAGHPGYTPARPAVVVHVDAFTPHYQPPARAGFVWIDGAYDPYGNWIPGYYEPVQTRAGYAWVPGYWAGNAWVAGFWRPTARAGYYWNPGYYAGRTWVAGSWMHGPRPSTVRYVRYAPQNRVVRYERPRTTVVHQPARNVVRSKTVRSNPRPVTSPSRTSNPRPASSSRPSSSSRSSSSARSR